MQALQCRLSDGLIMADPKRHADGIKRLAGSSGVIPRDTGEAISFPDRATRDEMGKRYRFDSKDEGEARRGLKRFQQSSEYKRFSPYRKRLY